MNKIITIAHTKGGVGKSTIAWHLAHTLKKAGEDVSILDLDFQRTLYFINTIREKNEDLEPIDVYNQVDADTLISFFEENDKTLIVDIGGFDSDLNRIAMSYSDTIIVPISNTITEVIGFKTFEAILEETGLENIKVMLNNIHPNTKNFDDVKNAILKLESIELLESRVCRRKSFDTSMKMGRSILEFDDTKAIKEIEDLANEIKRL